jgi:hypothetical protein
MKHNFVAESKEVLMSAIKLSNELRQALSERPSGPIPIEDDQTKGKYVLLTKDDYFRLHDEYVRRELEVAFEQVDCGEVSELDMNALLAEANRRHVERQRQKA